MPNELPASSTLQADVFPSIPGYELLDLIGQGGMGVVYRVRDLRLSRQVAVKVLNARYAAHSAASDRFRSEAQITGQLQHPGIPAVHELGALSDGRPFLAMKLVKGRTLQALLEERPNPQHDLGRFIAIFENICHAVGYAHAHRVIHRDLKPANIMVGAFGEVQVMDWGLAKVLDPSAERQAETSQGNDPDATRPEVSEIETPKLSSSATRTGSVLGTPAYMAPEQAGGEIRRLNPQSDVFGLGAILCQTLTGRPPYQGREPHRVQLLAVRGDIREVCLRLDSCGAEPDIVALCKRCLSFKQEDRPPDSQSVAEEVARIRNQAEARARQAEQDRTAALVREAEQRKRRRQFKLGAVVIAAVLLLGITGTAVGLIQAEVAHQAEKLRADNERAAKEQSQERLSQIEKGVGLFAELLRGLNPRAEEQGAPPLYEQLRERTVKAANELVGESVGDLEVVARLQTILGETLCELGDAGKAVEVLEQARATREATLGADHLDTLTTLDQLATAYHSAGRRSEALALFKQVWDARVNKLGADHPDSLTTLDNLALAHRDASRFSEAIHLLEQVRDIRVRKQGADHFDTLVTLDHLAGAYSNAGKLPQAIGLFEQVRDTKARKLGTDHAETLSTLNNLAGTYLAAGNQPEAIILFEQVHDARVKKLGTNHPSTLISLNNLAFAYRAAGKLPQAIALFEQARDAFQKNQGADHPHTLTTLDNLAGAYLAAGKSYEAIALFEQVRDARVRKLGADHSDTLTTLSNLAAAYQEAGKVPEAIALVEQVLDTQLNKLGADHPAALTTLNNLAVTYYSAGKLREAIALYEQVRDSKIKKLGADHPTVLTTLNNLAMAYRKVGRVPEAIALYEQVREAQLIKLGADHPSTVGTLSDLARAYQDAGRLPEAIALHEQAAMEIEKQRFQHELAGDIIANTTYGYEQAKEFGKAEAWQRKWLAVVKDRNGADSTVYASELAALASYLLNQQKWTAAEEILKECLVIRDKKAPDDWRTCNTRSMLGGALLGQKKFADAEPLLLKGYEGMKPSQAKVSAAALERIPEAMQRLIRLYEEMGKTDEAAKYRAEFVTWFSAQLEKHNAWQVLWGWPRF